VTSVSWPTAEIVGIGQPRQGTRHHLLVERPEVLDRSAAAPTITDIHVRHLADGPDRASDLE
jgi:hypothetical protein